MANAGYVSARLLGLPAEVRRVMSDVFDYILPNLRFGPPDQPKAENFSAFYVSSTTPATANQEFSIQHGMGRIPYLALPVVPTGSVGAQTVPLLVSRAADAQRVYFKSTSTSAPIVLLLE